jgi:predicted NBD/HSP70 family sugar kinase
MLIAIDTGGTKTLVTSFNEDGAPSEEYRFPTPKDNDEYIATLETVLREHYDADSIDAIAIAVPGIVKNNVAMWCVNLGWENFDIANRLRHFTKAPVLIENDANLAGLAEIRALNPIPHNGLYVTISTGIGTGILIDGAIEPAFSTSEGGHILVEYDGVLRQWQAFASGKAIRETYGKFARDIHDETTWEQIADKISRGFLAIIPILQPDVIVIGGSIGTFFDQYNKKLELLLKEHLPYHIPCPRFYQAIHPEEAVIYGCYYYATQKLALD